MIVLGVDAGYDLGATVLDGARLLHVETIDGAHYEALATSKRNARGVERTRKRLVWADDAIALIGEIGEIAMRWHAEALVIETIGEVTGRKGGLSVSHAQSIAGTSLLAGALLGWASQTGLRVRLTTAGEVREALLGSARAGDEAVEAHVLAVVCGWPKRSNAHVRDAALAALLGVERP